LHPTLGHPGKEEEFAALCSREEERHKAALKLIVEQTQSSREKERKGMVHFLHELAKIVKSQLHTMDAFVYPTEITGSSG
jgi:hypothetical protein